MGVMFGSQWIYAGWFSVYGGFGILYDRKPKTGTISLYDACYNPYPIPGPRSVQWQWVRSLAAAVARRLVLTVCCR